MLCITQESRGRIFDKINIVIITLLLIVLNQSNYGY